MDVVIRFAGDRAKVTEIASLLVAIPGITIISNLNPPYAYELAYEAPLVVDLKEIDKPLFDRAENKFTSEQTGVLNQSVEILSLTARAYNGLIYAGIKTIRHLIWFTESELLDIRNFGQRSLDDVNRQLSFLGLSLGIADYPRLHRLPEGVTVDSLINELGLDPVILGKLTSAIYRSRTNKDIRVTTIMSLITVLRQRVLSSAKLTDEELLALWDKLMSYNISPNNL